MLTARRALATSTRLFGPACHPETLRGQQAVRPSFFPLTRRNFGARIRRRGAEELDDTAQAWSASAPAQPTSEEVSTALAAALAGEVDAVRHLGAVAAELGGVAEVSVEAEDALHQVLLQASGEHCEELRVAAEEALQLLWNESGNPEVNASVRRGVALMDKEHPAEAAAVFTEVVERLPAFAEGWNKRATARFLMQDIDGALADCERVLALKPRHFGCLSGAGMCHQSRGDLKAAARFFRRALAVRPEMEGPQMRAQAMEAQALINDHLRPRIVSVVQALNDASQVPSLVPEGLSCTWDICKEPAAVVDADPGWYYFVRVRILNQSGGPNKVRSLARFYVFRFANGRMLPLTLLTEGPAGFTLAPGEDYSFSWHLVSSQELERAVGGMLLENAEDAATIFSEEDRPLLDADLGETMPIEATPDEVERMRLGYPTIGRLDLRRMDAERPVWDVPSKPEN